MTEADIYATVSDDSRCNGWTDRLSQSRRLSVWPRWPRTVGLQRTRSVAQWRFSHSNSLDRNRFQVSSACSNCVAAGNRKSFQLLVCEAAYTTHYTTQRPLCWSLPAEATKTRVQAFISCRLDYCNSLLYGVTDKLMRQVQSVQNVRQGWYRSETSRTHHTDTASTSLVAGQTTSWIQDGQLGIPMLSSKVHT